MPTIDENNNIITNAPPGFNTPQPVVSFSNPAAKKGKDAVASLWPPNSAYLTLSNTCSHFKYSRERLTYFKWSRLKHLRPIILVNVTQLGHKSLLEKSDLSWVAGERSTTSITIRIMREAPSQWPLPSRWMMEPFIQTTPKLMSHFSLEGMISRGKKSS